MLKNLKIFNLNKNLNYLFLENFIIIYFAQFLNKLNNTLNIITIKIMEKINI